MPKGAKLLTILILALVPLVSGIAMTPVVSEERPGGCLPVAEDELILPADGVVPVIPPQYANQSLVEGAQNGPLVIRPVFLDLTVPGAALVEEVKKEAVGTACGMQTFDVIVFSDGTEFLVEPGVLRVEKVADGKFRAIYYDHED